MHSATLIFPNQLFKENPSIHKDRIVYLVEEELFFKQYHFHKQKLILHRATMKMYQHFLEDQQIKVYYIEATHSLCAIEKLIISLAKNGIREIHYVDVVDNWLEKKISKGCDKTSMKKIVYKTPSFINTLKDVNAYFDTKKTYFQTDFYIWQRKQRNILIIANNQPEGGKWSYDAENRLRFPKNEKPPRIDFPAENNFVKEARAYVEKHFSKNYGLSGHLVQRAKKDFYPTTFEEACKWLEDFLSTRFQKFGIYEDAIVSNEHFLHHSVLTPMLNTGLLTPQEVIEETIIAASKYNIPLNSLEGFIRQIIGWREFIRIVYEREGSKQRTKNFWDFHRKIPASFWKGETGIIPVDNVIKKLLAIGYTHHIERLMVMGNFMLLCEFDPDEVYRWFMEMYIDSYDWVMVPNVYGMTQFADGGLMTTKPYISGSNYLMKMGDYKKGSWQEIWDGLFWRFMFVHRDFFSQNPRLGMLLKTFDKMPTEKKNKHLQIAEEFLDGLDNGGA
ncbi:MAG: cryptochrome/photolyase family protein [Chitinophagaceae bacterium]